jgi:hypothetical protein
VRKGAYQYRYKGEGKYTGQQLRRELPPDIGTSIT